MRAGPAAKISCLEERTVILQSKDEFDQFMELDPGTGEYRFLSRKQYSELEAMPLSGGYSVVDGTIVCLYRTAGFLYLRIGEQEFQVTDDVTSILAREKQFRLFQLVQNGNVLVKFSYHSPVDEGLLRIDPTPFVDAEDFDFFLFVHNVLLQDGRRNRVYNQ